MNTRGGTIQFVVYLLAALALTWVLLLGGNKVKAQASPETTVGQQQEYQNLIRSVEGPDLFRAYCASCHGPDAKGGGPAAVAFKKKVPDLTMLAEHNGGKFPADYARGAILGNALPASHGSREMPVWGPIFHQIEWDVDRGNVRIENLVRYLELIQTLPSSEKLSGEQLYRQYCARCHGYDLKGGHPAQQEMRDSVPDLTTLAQRYGGKFPDKYVADVLQNGVDFPAHGPREMPVWGMDFRMVKDRPPEAEVTRRMRELKEYIRSVQAK